MRAVPMGISLNPDALHSKNAESQSVSEHTENIAHITHTHAMYTEERQDGSVFYAVCAKYNICVLCVITNRHMMLLMMMNKKNSRKVLCRNVHSCTLLYCVYACK